MIEVRESVMEEAHSLTVKATDLMECMLEAEALTKSAAAMALRCGRHEVGKAAKNLWSAWMIDIYKVFSRSVTGTNAQFQLWVAKGCRPPADAREACRLAVLGMFYGRAKIEMPGFGWRLVRPHGLPVMAEVTFANKNGRAIKWVVDAPRLGDAPAPEADLFIYPALGEAEQKTPPGKWYTWDLSILGARPYELRGAVKLKK
jgi:hypothetical protein